MPRQLTATMTLDAMEDEARFTRAALGADPDASDLADATLPWIADVDTERDRERDLRQRDLSNVAHRVIANARLDAACTRFGDDLLHALKKDRKSLRWTTFFPEPVSAFVRQPLADQLRAVSGWLSSEDPALAAHRDALTTWHKVAQQALDAEAQIRTAQGEQRQRREALAKRLTNARDALHDQLSARARERDLDRSWADTFFLRT